MANPNVSSLPNYVEEHSDLLISRSVLGFESGKLFNLMSGVKGDTALNLLKSNVDFQDGSSCGWSANTGETISQRIVHPKVLKVNQAFCYKNFLKTWMNYQVQVAAGRETLPFEEKFMEAIALQINEKLEKMVYQGASGSTTECEGLCAILDAESAVTTNVSATSGTTAYNFLKKVAKAINVKVKNPVILVSKSLYREFMQDLVTANLYHYNPADGNEYEYKMPGLPIRVIGVGGLEGTSSYDWAIAAELSNINYAVDMEGDKDTFDFWWSKDNQEHRLAVEFLAGVQVAWPEEITVGKRAK